MIQMKPVDDYDKGFVITGHAGFAESGQDIVCSAVSAMAQMTTMALGKLSILHIDKYSGYLKVQIVNDTHMTDLLMDSLIDAMQELERQYPQNIQVEGDYQHAKVTQ